MNRENEVASEIIDAAIEVHRTLGGPGLLESIYEESLSFELRLRHLFVERQKVVPIVYKGHSIAVPLRLDMVVSPLVIVECKATTEYNKIYENQLLTYLRLTGLKPGLVINFGEALVKNGIHRVINSCAFVPLRLCVKQLGCSAVFLFSVFALCVRLAL